MEPIRKKILLTYLISIGVATLLMSWMWLSGEKSLNWTTIFMFGATKFLSGFGLFLTLMTATIFVLTKFGDTFKAHKKRLDLFNIVMLIIIPIVLLVYYFYKIFQTYFAGASADQWYDNLIFIYGIVSLLWSLYIQPTINENLLDATETTTGDKAKRKVKDLGRGLKKRWFTWRKDYAKATVQDALTLKEVGNLMKQRVAIIMLPVIGLGMLMFTPVAVICILFFLELLINADLIRYPERGGLIASMIVIAVISAILPFVATGTGFYKDNPTVQQYWWVLSLVYFVGLVISTFIFIKRLLNMQGYSLLEWSRKRIANRKEKLKDHQKTLDEREKEIKAKEKEVKKKAKEVEKQKVADMKKLENEKAKYPDK